MGRRTRSTLSLSEELLRPAPTDPSTVYSEITLRKETSKAHYEKQAQPPLMPLSLGSHAYAAISTGEPLDLWSRCFQSVATVLQHRHWQPHPPSKLSSVTTSWTPTKYPSALSTTALCTVFPTSNTKQFKSHFSTQASAANNNSWQSTTPRKHSITYGTFFFLFVLVSCYYCTMGHINFVLDFEDIICLYL